MRILLLEMGNYARYPWNILARPLSLSSFASRRTFAYWRNQSSGHSVAVVNTIFGNMFPLWEVTWMSSRDAREEYAYVHCISSGGYHGTAISCIFSHQQASG
ncbi:hypothetical protein BC629DRAFT_1554538 [Irpex lacteus]|nr:hypothetical protein BC629DRAFT_1554538 [Irpex lacteus]